LYSRTALPNFFSSQRCIFRKITPSLPPSRGRGWRPMSYGGKIKFKNEQKGENVEEKGSKRKDK
jgi:hypothetical protein